MDVDIAIIGAGPAGLCLAQVLSGQGLQIALIEKQSRAALADPAFDGREIALTHSSHHLLQRMGLWDRLPIDDLSPLRDARVFNGPSPFALHISAQGSTRDQLGWLVPNHRIRQAAYEGVAECGDVTLIDNARVLALDTDSQCARITLDDGRTIQAKLAVAADSRFSDARRAMGIGARMRDFGKTMLVARVAHEKPHHHAAWEWFGYGQTLALLPLNGDRASVVVTLPQHAMQRLVALDDAQFGLEMQHRFQDRLGAMQLLGSRHTYPLVGVYANQFVGQRFALVGDAAVGMHPVTAHGFNLGLRSIETLARSVKEAIAHGQDIAAPALLSRYERSHRAASLPLYLATNLVASLYTDDRTPARLVRNATLRAANLLAPFKRAIATHLTA